MLQTHTKKSQIGQWRKVFQERKCYVRIWFLVCFIFIFILCKLYLSNHNGSTFFFILNFVFFSYLNTCLMTWLVVKLHNFCCCYFHPLSFLFFLFLLVDYLICTNCRFHLNRQLAFFSFRMMFDVLFHCEFIYPEGGFKKNWMFNNLFNSKDGNIFRIIIVYECKDSNEMKINRIIWLNIHTHR